MAMGWRGRGRRPDVGEERGGKDGAAGGRTRALSRIDDLWRRAEWPWLSPEDRAAACRPYADPAPSASPAWADGADPDTQAWVAALVAPHLQPEATAVVRAWIEDGAPNTHLWAAGPSGRGKMSVVATHARRALAGRPPAPDYCYVPDAQALGHTHLLALPAGTGVRFTDALSAALRQILGHWDKPRALVPAGAEAAEGDDEALRRYLIARMLDPVAAAGPEVARPYLARLAAALEAYAAAHGAPQVVEADLPAGRLQAPPIEGVAGGPAAADAPAGALGAPVIVASLARMDLARSLVRANGGVLVLNAAELVERDQPNAEWATLRAALRSESIPMRGTGEPQVPLSVRVALVGGYAATRVLERADDFLRLFRYKALFEDDADWTRAAEAAYAVLADGVARRYALPAFAGEAVGALIEEGARRTPGRNRSRVSTDVLALRDVALEAGRRALARQDLGAPATTAADVAAALAARRARHGVAGRDAREEILLGREIVPTAGAAVGQVNGLSVISPVTVEGRYSTPLRLTATVSPARDEQLLDIEREADLADSSHVTGSLTMAGYLAWRYGGQRPISLTVRLRFEQEILYSAGPSASAAELFAVLSALADAPIRASLAVTGAVGQHGEIQPIGGVNDKIEGFWEICRRRRAQGEEPVGAYGVLIPAANTADLMLRPAVAESIAGEAWFHVWPIAEVDEGLELLTGLPAGEIHARADRRLQHFYELAQRHGR